MFPDDNLPGTRFKILRNDIVRAVHTSLKTFKSITKMLHTAIGVCCETGRDQMARTWEDSKS